jgi:hypothetical protein
MKKLLILAIVVSVASMASASIVLVASNPTPIKGETITMTIKTDASEAVSTFQVGIIRDDVSGGLAATGTLHSGFTQNTDVGYRGDVLGLGDDAGDIGYMSGAVNPPAYITGTSVVLYTYTYTVSPSALPGVINFTIPDTSGSPYFFTSQVGLYPSATVGISGTSVTVIPEPATIALLGLGGLLLRRRK